jgi:hypothetical protein
VKRFFNLFVLTTAEQRLVIVLVLLLVAAAWYKHSHDLKQPRRLPTAPSVSPAPP